MTSWNYRVISKTSPGSQQPCYQIYEVYYFSDGSIDCWNDNPVEPLGGSEVELRNDIQAFLAAFRLPVLEQQYLHGQAKLTELAPTGNSRDLQLDYINKSSRASHYLKQVLGNHLLLKQDPQLRQAFEKVDQALAELHAVAESNTEQSTLEKTAVQGDN